MNTIINLAIAMGAAAFTVALVFAFFILMLFVLRFMIDNGDDVMLWVIVVGWVGLTYLYYINGV